MLTLDMTMILDAGLLILILIEGKIYIKNG